MKIFSTFCGVHLRFCLCLVVWMKHEKHSLSLVLKYTINIDISSVHWESWQQQILVLFSPTKDERGWWENFYEVPSFSCRCGIKFENTNAFMDYSFVADTQFWQLDWQSTLSHSIIASLSTTDLLANCPWILTYVLN